MFWKCGRSDSPMKSRTHSLQPQKISQDELFRLFQPEHADELARFTRNIEFNPQSVLAFQQHFEDLMEAEECNWESSPAQDEFLDRAFWTVDELQGHLDGMSSQRFKGIFLVFLNHGRVQNEESSVTLEVGWLDAMVGLVIWDRWTETVENPVLAFASVGFLADRLAYRCAPPEKIPADPPLYRYHPERFKASHDCAEHIGKIYCHGVNPSHGFLTIDQLQEVMGVVMHELNEKAMSYPLRLRQQAQGANHIIDGLEGLVTAYGRFVQAGRQILDFPPSLVEMLSQTDVSDIPMNAIKMPYAAQYLHFGPQVHMELEPGWLVDGAYIESHGTAGDWRITITAYPQDKAQTRLWFVSPEPTYTQDFVEHYRLMDMATAVTMVLSNRLADLNERTLKPGGDITEDVRQEVEKKGIAIPGGTRLIDVSNVRAEERIALNRQKHPVYLEALQLTVNALCYVTAYPDDIAEVWPDGTPSTLKQKTGSPNAKEARRAKSKLASLGYVPVHICGQKLAGSMQANTSRDRQEGHVSPHWRRGHWRNQPYGLGRSLRKLIWVMPVLVGASRPGEEPEAGHLYLVS